VGAYAAILDDCQAITRPALADLAALASGPGGRRLVVFEYPWDSFEPLACLPALEILKVQSTGALQRLAGLEALSGLRVLVVSPPPSWEGSDRRLEVESYAPLQSLAKLEQLTLLRVRPRDLDLAPIRAMRHLEELHLAGVPDFTIEHYARLAAALPETQGRSLQPWTEIEGVGRCGRCNGKTVLLTAPRPRARQWLCPKCNAKKLAEYLAEWEAHKRAGGST
jgi:hypothetical protein